MSTARRYHHTYADYRRLEGESPSKLEDSDGEIFAMAGGPPEHGALAMQFFRLISVPRMTRTRSPIHGSSSR